jgi:hypothetical protein
VKRLLLPLATLTVVGCASTGTAAPAASPTPATQAGAPAAAQAGGPQAGAPARASGLRPFAELTRDATERNGFFDTYEKGDALYMAVPKEWLDRDFLLTFQIAQGIGAGGLFGGTMLNIFEGSVVAFEQHGERLFLVQKPVRFTAPEGSPAARAVDLSFGSSVLESAKVESIRGDSARIINIYDWVVSDLSDVSSRVRGAGVTGPQTGPPPAANFDRGRSHLETVKAFPDNVNVRAKLTFRPASLWGSTRWPTRATSPSPSSTHSPRLPDEPMEPRLADDRVGYFMTVRKDFSSTTTPSSVRYVNRWRLECAARRCDGLCEPKKPIVYYIDRTVPDEYRPYLIAGVNNWNRRLRGRRLPQRDPRRDAPGGRRSRGHPLRDSPLEHQRSAGLRRHRPQSIVDPRTGEILDADILFEANMIQGFRATGRRWSAPRRCSRRSSTSRGGRKGVAMGEQSASFAASFAGQGALLRALLGGAGRHRPRRGGAARVRRSGHQVGHHARGRAHPRPAPQLPLLSRHAAGYAARPRLGIASNGVFSSVMEYPAHEHRSAAGEGAGLLLHHGPARTTAGPSPTATRRRARAARSRGRPRSPVTPTAPTRTRAVPARWTRTSTYYDLGATRWPGARAGGAHRLAVGGSSRACAYDNARYADLTDAFQTLLVQYSRALGTVVKYIGGQYQYRDRVGDPDGRGPFVPVPRAKQLEALEFLATSRVRRADAFAVPREVLAAARRQPMEPLGRDQHVQRSHRLPAARDGARRAARAARPLTNPFVFARIRDAEMKFGARTCSRSRS